MVNLYVSVNHFDREDRRSDRLAVEISEDGSDTVTQLKQKIATALGNPAIADKMFLEWMGKPMGNKHDKDTKDEAALTLSDFNVVFWVQKFDSMHVVCKYLRHSMVEERRAKGLDWRGNPLRKGPVEGPASS